jgi:hypothetical protein
LAYKDGTRPPNADPHLGTLAILLLYEGIIFIVALFFIDKYVIPGIDAFIFKDVEGIVYGSGMLMAIIIWPPSYYYFIKKKKFDAYYQEFRYAGINTKRNRTIGYISCILLMVILLATVLVIGMMHPNSQVKLFSDN